MMQNYFIFIGYLQKGGGRGGGSSEPPELPLDTPLAAELSLIFVQHFDCFMVCSIVLIWRISTTISGRNVQTHITKEMHGSNCFSSYVSVNLH